VLSTPNPLGFPAILYELARSKRRFYAADHVYSFASRWVERMLHQCDYQVAVVESVGLWLPGFVIPGVPVALSHQVIYVANPNT